MSKLYKVGLRFIAAIAFILIADLVVESKPPPKDDVAVVCIAARAVIYVCLLYLMESIGRVWSARRSKQ